ncbi:Caprin-1 [Trichinella zimbabwensis]|uniref:Caprin-1 n=2 Tax=Trichinella zimbabwensis TaxID=268475 RepID=A0A0V1IA11_9BILA|nr:Caprin-1 [Trichinella zimbabwensis]
MQNKALNKKELNIEECFPNCQSYCSLELRPFNMPTVDSISEHTSTEDGSESMKTSQNSNNNTVMDLGLQIRQMLEKKIRNMEKRKAKLENLKEALQTGKTLHPEQEKATEKVSELNQQLEMSREILKNVNTMINEHNRQQKLLQKKEHRDRMQAEHARFRNLLNMQELLNVLGNNDVRVHFAEGTEGAVKLSPEDLHLLDFLYQKICPSYDDVHQDETWAGVLDEAADCVCMLLSASQKLVPTFNVSFRTVRAVIDGILECEYYKRRTNDQHNSSERRSSSEEKSKKDTEESGFEDSNVANGNVDQLMSASQQLQNVVPQQQQQQQQQQPPLSQQKAQQYGYFNEVQSVNNENVQIAENINKFYAMSIGGGATFYSQNALLQTGTAAFPAVNDFVVPTNEPSVQTHDGSIISSYESQISSSQDHCYPSNPECPSQVAQFCDKGHTDSSVELPAYATSPDVSEDQHVNRMEQSEDDMTGFQNVRGSRSRARYNNAVRTADGFRGGRGRGRGGRTGLGYSKARGKHNNFDPNGGSNFVGDDRGYGGGGGSGGGSGGGGGGSGSGSGGHHFGRWDNRDVQRDEHHRKSAAPMGEFNADNKEFSAERGKEWSSDRGSSGGRRVGRGRGRYRGGNGTRGGRE